MSLNFAELKPGRVIELGPVSVTAQEIVEFARAYDPQWFHADPERAAAGRWGGVIASGWQTCGLAMRLAVESVLEGSDVVASPGLAYLKWPNPVRAGDRLTLSIEVLETRRSASRPNLGIVRWRWRMVNQRGEDVLDLEATNLYDVG